jgi:hypothetical protein
MTTHMVIPDLQIRPEAPTAHLGWIGRYILDRRPDVVVQIGDAADMHSLSSWSSKMEMEGLRYKADLKAFDGGWAELNRPLLDYNATRARYKERQWWPRRVVTLGNHEYRIQRCIDADPKLEGLMSMDDLDFCGWETVPFLEPIDIDGVVYCHYFVNRMTGKPLGGQALTRLKQLGHTYVMGHQQTLDVACRYVLDRQQWGVIAGAAYPFSEDYLGVQGNQHWRGVIVLHQVEDGAFDPMFVSLDYLCRKYEGVPLAEFMED